MGTIAIMTFKFYPVFWYRSSHLKPHLTSLEQLASGHSVLWFRSVGQRCTLQFQILYLFGRMKLQLSYGWIIDSSANHRGILASKPVPVVMSWWSSHWTWELQGLLSFSKKDFFKISSSSPPPPPPHPQLSVCAFASIPAIELKTKEQKKICSWNSVLQSRACFTWNVLLVTTVLNIFFL